MRREAKIKRETENKKETKREVMKDTDTRSDKLRYRYFCCR
jgi:hypothetical protein